MVKLPKKQLYIAAPFFTPAQVETVKLVEKTITDCGCVFYSPRLDGVLKDMLPEERKAKSTEVFKLNVRHIIQADGMLCILDDKDTGTTWESGFAYYHRRYNLGKHSYRIFAYTSGERELNVMLAKSFDGHAQGVDALKALLGAYAQGVPLPTAIATDNVY